MRGTPFRERDPLVLGAVGIAVVAALVLLAFNVDKVAFLGGPTYRAAFSEAGGLKPGDDVRIAGVKVGEVKGVDLDGDHVRVTFALDEDRRLGDRTTASVRIKTLLGAKFLALAPDGRGRLREDGEIPLARTTPAYDVVEAFSDLTTTTERLDTDRLAQALDTISTTFADTPEEVRAAVDGLGRLSRTVASRDEQVRSLLSHSRGVTEVLAARNVELTRLLADGDLLLQELRRRREAISRLLDGTVALSQQLTALVRENRAAIGPALRNLQEVVETLRRNQGNLDRSIAALAPFVRVYANTLGNGRWFDTYVQNLTAVPGGPGNPR